MPQSPPSDSADAWHISGRMLYYNNIGCAQLRAGNINLSSLFFSKALCEMNKLEAIRDSNMIGSVLSPTQRDDILYNTGISYLYNRLPSLALNCFGRVSDAYAHRPMYWLRMAECCIMQYSEDPESSLSENETSRMDLLCRQSLFYSCPPQTGGRIIMR